MNNNVLPLSTADLLCPAFSVKDGVIYQVNEAAAQRNIHPSTSVGDIIHIGRDDYANFTGGRLFLSLNVSGSIYSASVSAEGELHLFQLETEYAQPELRAFALAAQELREPLSCALAESDQLFSSAAISKDSDTVMHLAKLNRNLHQILRTVTNMSDAGYYASQNSCTMAANDLIGFLDELLHKASALAENSGIPFVYHLPHQLVYCRFDSEQIERAVHNLISNAMKFSSGKQPIRVNVACRNARLYFVIENDCERLDPYVLHSFFSRYAREPGLEDPRSGIGLGLSIVRSVAQSHSGTVLVESTGTNNIRVSMSIQLKLSEKDRNTVHSDLMLYADYAGGYDHTLLELSDVLQSELYNEKL